MKVSTANHVSPWQRCWLRNWFLICLTFCIVAGLAAGGGIDSRLHQRIEQSVGSVPPKVMVAFVLLLMSITLPTHDLRTALKSPAPAIWACLVNMLVIPLLAWPLSLLQTTDDFRLGLLIAASVPSTMAAASVWTRHAGGNDAVSLLVTAVTNGSCWLISPFWLSLLGGSIVQLDVGRLALMLMVSGMLPILLGQFLRQWGVVSRWVDPRKSQFGMVAQCCILILVAWAAFQGGPSFAEGGRAGLMGFVVVGLCCIALHLTGMGIAIVGSRTLGFARRDMIAVAFAGSQKTLPIGILLSEAIGLPLALFPMLMFHASQLFIDTPIATRFAADAETSRPISGKE